MNQGFFIVAYPLATGQNLAEPSTCCGSGSSQEWAGLGLSSLLGQVGPHRLQLKQRNEEP